MLVQQAKRLFTVDEYHQMARAGILTETDRVELIEGEIIAMSPIGVRHAACVKRLNDLFSLHFRGEAIISVQDPIKLSRYSEPEPDVALLRYRADYYAEKTPEAADVLLIVEVADTTVAFDRQVKEGLYARAGIQEYWIVNLVDSVIEVYRQPADGTYKEHFQVQQGETVTAVAFPTTTFTRDDLIS